MDILSYNADKEALKLEWLETNGLGGYSSSTLLNCHTRKYHGLLIANLAEPPGRYVLLSKFEDSIYREGQELVMSHHQYPGVLFPGHDYFLKEFLLDKYPQFIYNAEGISVRKSIMMIHGEDSLLVRYDIESCPSSCLIRLKTFLAYRGYHKLAKQNMFLKGEASEIKNGFTIEPYKGMPALFIRTNVNSRFSPSLVWYNQFEYQSEKERGYEWHEDLFMPGIFEIPIKTGSVIIISSSLKVNNEVQLEEKWKLEITKRAHETSITERITTRFIEDEDRINVRDLITAGQQFLIRTPKGRPTIIAGYHWFGDWGRDTLISLPGLTFCCGRPQEGIEILTTFENHEKEGLLPNYFSDGETENAYNSVDASLWYFWAVQQMLKYTGEVKLIEDRIWPVIKSIVNKLMAGTVLDIFMNNDNGLLHAGNEDTQLTWMDAMVDGKPVTPRWGYAVEINALWFNAIGFADELAHRFDDREYFFSDLMALIRRSFSDAFWMAEGGYLADLYNEGHRDDSIRPNQILAVSLPYSPLNSFQSIGVVNKVKEHLLTPVGLRTLSREDRRYKGRYSGDGASRDSAYHQGTVWPWLLAHFGEAYLKVSEDKAAARSFLLKHMRAFISCHMKAAGIGSISEIFDGDPPYSPNGCISQAWSVAELIRLYSVLNEKSYPYE